MLNDGVHDVLLDLCKVVTVLLGQLLTIGASPWLPVGKVTVGDTGHPAGSQGHRDFAVC